MILIFGLFVDFFTCRWSTPTISFLRAYLIFGLLEYLYTFVIPGICACWSSGRQGGVLVYYSQLAPPKLTSGKSVPGKKCSGTVTKGLSSEGLSSEGLRHITYP